MLYLELRENKKKQKINNDLKLSSKQKLKT